MTALPPLSVPILHNVDVLVVGASSAAVAAALEVRRAGRSVMVVSDLSYLGDDLAGTLHLWQNGCSLEDPLLAAAFAGAAPFPARPAAIKHAMETALLGARIPFLYLARPIALLRDESGGIAGAVLAARTSLMAVTCRAVIDATRQGICARLAGMPLQPREGTSVEWTILAKQAPEWPGEIEEAHPHYQAGAGGRAFLLKLDSALLGTDPAAAEHVARSLLVDENVFVTADILLDGPGKTPTAGSKHRVAGLSDADLQPAGNLWLLNELLPLSADGLGELRAADALIALGRRVGALAAGAAPRGPAGTGFIVQAGGENGGDFRFAEAFLRNPEGTLELSGWSFPSLGRFDVAVAGGGTGGAPAGIAAARTGASTLVLEIQHALGGVGTVGLIASYWFGNKVGFTAALNDEVSRADSRSRSKNGNIWNPEVKIGMYHRLLQAAGGRAWLGSYAFGVRMRDGKVDGLLVSTPFGSGLVEADCVVDATGNADIAAAAGAPCRLIDARHVAVQGTGLSPRRDPSVRHQNSDHTFVEETDPAGVTCAYVHARAKYPEHFDTSPLVNSRERRQIIGELEISPLDILAGRTFPDTVFTARSNFDTHGFVVHPVFMVAAPDHKPLQAHVPFRCMLPRGVEGVLVTGLGMSAHRDALPVIRMQADVQNQGYAAGLAAADAARQGISLRRLDIRALQRKLVTAGNLAPEVAAHEDSFPLPKGAVSEAAAGDLGALMNTAILFAHADRSRGPLLDILERDPDPARRGQAALVLGLMGVADAAPALEEMVRRTPWDEGWNYRGMGQFGASMSPLDAKIIALARTGSSIGVAAIEEKIRALDESAAFSHCRAVSLAASALSGPRLASALAALLANPGMRGHAWLTPENFLAEANDDLIETESRNLALRELYLGRGLFLAGDVDGIGQTILESYADDLRGHFARHARAVLEHSDPDALRTQIA